MKKWDDFRCFNRVRFINGLMQVGLISTLILGVVLLLPYISVRWDFSQNRSNSLGNEVKSFLGALKEPLNIYLLTDGTQPEEDFLPVFKIYLHALEQEYKKHNAFSFKMIHVLREPKQLLQLKKQYKFEKNTGVLMVLGGQCAFVPFEAFYTKEKSLRCAACLVNTLYKLSIPPKNIYWMTGHCELEGQNVHPSKGGSMALQLLQQLRCNVQFLGMCHTIPEDADGIVIFGPQVPFFPEECVALKQYLFQRHGRIWVCLHPVYNHGLNPFLKALGMACDADLLLDNGKDYVESDGNIIIRRYNPHPMVQSLIDKNLGLVFGLSSTLRLLQSDKYIFPCIFSSETSWNKPAAYLQNLTFNEKTDKRGPHLLGAAFISYLSSHFQSDFPAGQAVVVTCADWMDNAHINILGNHYFFQSIYHTLFNDNASPFFAPEVAQQPLQLIISRHHFLSLILTAFVLPFCFFLLGVITLIVRRN